MKKEEIHLDDIHRILFGQAPVEFLLEVLIRTLATYIALLILMRLLGKRMDGQITIIEIAVMITLGAMAAVAMQMPDRGVLQALTALLCALIFHRGINWLNVKSDKIENITQGKMSILVKDGIMQLDEMKSAGITKQNVFATLRSNKILNLGKVKRLYLEACGLFNIYEEKDDRPGLPVLPAYEDNFIKAKTKVDQSHVACKNCGYVMEISQQDKACLHCGEKEWMEAIIN
jgi:uncharacterized membrane protein YcaP (DUF421 family)